MRYLIFLLHFVPSFVLCQDLSGVWIGTIEVNGSEVPYQLYLEKDNNDYKGYGMTSMQIEGYEQIGIKTIQLQPKKEKFILEDDELVFNNFSIPGKRMILFATLNMEENRNQTRLTGKFKTRSVDMRDRTSYAGSITLNKLKPGNQAMLMTKLEQLKIIHNESSVVRDDIAKNTSPTGAVTHQETKEKPTLSNKTLPGAAASVNNRGKELIQEFEIETDSVQLFFYDNGIVDGDTISVLLDNDLIVSRELLSTKAIQRTIRFPNSKNSMDLIMYAESLGSIPPNSGILIMQSGKKRMEIRFIGDMTKSPSIRIKRK